MTNNRTTIIAEAGVNHNGSIKLAKEMIDIAANSGADYVKFQTFKAEELVTKNAEKANYQKNLLEKNESQFEMLKKLELSKEEHYELKNHCNLRKINFLSTAFDIKSLKFLHKFGINLIKIPSGEITNLPYLTFIGGMKQPVIVSTGMSSMDEINSAINILINEGTKKDQITVLHCNTEYPTPIKDVNLLAMLSIKNEFNVNVGYSDHTLGIEIPIAAVALGAKVIEKHFTLDRSFEGPDHSASLDPNELKIMIEKIRNIEYSLGSGIKKPSNSEIKNIPIARRSIVAKTFIRKGEIFSKKNITTKRPGTGISPMKWDELLGTESKYDFEIDDLIKL